MTSRDQPMKTLLVCLRTTAVTLGLTGILYPLLVTGLAQLLFPHQANGSLLKDDRGNVMGSSLLGQPFTSDAYFHGRPSAAGANGYDATASGGANLGPTSQALKTRMQQGLASLRARNPHAPAAIPDDLITASASGLDPHITPAAAHWQVPRVATARHVHAQRVSSVVEAHVEGRTLGFLGEPRVNVLELNLALDRQFGRPASANSATP